jgi:hypothetical protein
MPTTDKDLKRATEWCRGARAILKTKGLLGRNATELSDQAKAAHAKVKKNLEELKKKAVLPPGTYEMLAGEFVTLSELGKDSAEYNDPSLALTLTAQLEHLSNRVDFALRKITDTTLDESTDVALAESRTTLIAAVTVQYEKVLDAAKRRQLELEGKKQGMFTFHEPVAKLIADAVIAANTAGSSERETSLTNAITILKDVEKEYLAAVARHTDCTNYSIKDNEARLKRAQLFLIGPTYTAGIDEVLRDATALANASNFAGAVTKLDKPLTTAYDKAIRDNNVSKPQQAYIAKMAQAKAHERDLFARSKSGKNYAESISKNIAIAETFASVNPPDFVSAAQALADTQSLYDTLNRMANEDEQKQLTAARQKPVYEDEVIRIENAISKLKELPGTKSAVTELQRLLTAGSAKLTATEDYEQAYNALAGLTAAYQQGLTAAKNFDATVGNELYRTNLAEAKLQLQRLDGLVGRSQFELIAEKQKVIDDSMMRVSNGGSVDTETLTIGTLAVDLKRKANDVVPLRDDCIRKKTEATARIKAFQERYLIAKYDILPKFREAEAEFGLDNYLLATQLYTDFITELTRIEALPENEPAYDVWQIVQADLKITGAITSLAKVRSESCQSLLQFAPLESETTALLNNLSQTRNYIAANEVAARVRVAALDIEDILTRYRSMDNKRGELRNFTNAEIAAATTKIDELKTKLGDVEQFKNLLDTFKNEWEKSLMTAFDTEGAFDAAFVEFKTNLANKIVAPITNMLADPTELLKSQEAAKTNSTAKLIKQKLLEISATIKSMNKDALAYESFGYTTEIDAATTELKNLTELAKDPAEYVNALNQLSLLGDKLTVVIGKLGRDRVAQSDAAKQALQDCLTSLNLLKSSHKKFEPYFRALTGRVGDLRSMADSQICSTVQKCGETANALKSREITPLTDAFTAIDVVLDNINININDRDLNTHLPERYKILNFRFEKEVKLDLYSKGPVAGKAAAEGFLNDVRTAVQNAKDALRIKEEIKRLVSECNSKLALMTDVPHLQASFLAMITSASTPLEGGEVSALQRLRSILGQIETLLSPAAAQARLEMEKNTREQETTAKLRLAQYQSKRDVLDKNQIRQAAERKKGMESDEVNSDLYKQIAELRKEADKMLEKGLVDTAFEKLEAARTTALQFLNNPFSIQVTARKNLSKVGERWAQTISTFVKSMNSLQIAVSDSMTVENQSTPGKFNIQEVMSPLSEATRSFEATKFVDYIQKIVTELAKDKMDLAAAKAYREAKEDALRFVRAYQTIVQKDPVLLSAASNPFGVNVSLRSVGDALRDLEVNLRRA